jgi:hypothetical protein
LEGASVPEMELNWVRRTSDIGAGFPCCGEVTSLFFLVASRGT